MTDTSPPEPGDDDIATAEDIATLNRMAVERSASFARIAGATMLVVGVLGVLAWAWIVVRTQLEMSGDDSPSGIPPVDGFDDPTFSDRVDVVTAYLTQLVFAVLAGGAGLAVRAAADYMVARTGGSLTGFRIGDALSAPGPDLVLGPSGRDHA